MSKNIDYKIRVGVIGDAQLQKFQRTVDRINKSAKANTTQLKRMGDGMQRMGSLARSAAVALVGMFSVQQVQTAIKFADAIGKTADKLGIGTDALQEYRFAAEQTGVSQQAFDVGFQRFTRRTAEAAKGTGVLAKEFKALGISLQNTDGSLKSNEELFRRYADAIQKTGSTSEQLRLAFAAFDTEGAGLVNLLKDGSDGLDRFSQAAQDAGVVMSEKVIRDAERLADAFGQISLQIKANLYPVLIGIADLVLNVGRWFRQFGEDLIALHPPAVAVAASVGALAAAFGALLVPAVAAGLTAITLAIKAFIVSNPFTLIAAAVAAVAVLLYNNWEIILNGIAQWVQRTIIYFQNLKVGALEALKPLIVGVATIFDQVWNSAIRPALLSMVQTLQEVTHASSQIPGVELDGLSNKLVVMEDRFSKLSNVAGAAGAQVEKAMTSAAGASGAAAVELARLREEAEALNAPLEETELVVEELNLNLENVGVSAGKAAGGTKKLAKAAKEAKTEMEKAADSLKSSMGSAIEDGIINAAKGGEDAFKNMAQSILEDIARMIIQLKIVKPLMNALFPEGGGGLGGLFGSARGNYFPQGITGKPLTAFASGGIIGGRSVIGSNLIGENGPEAVVPLRRHNGKMGVSASPVNINVVNNAGSEVKVSESTGNDGSRMIDIMIEQKVKNAFATGGMDKIMQSRFGSRAVGG